MKKVLAISGGVDSMLLLFAFKSDKDAVVAHFDHGTRPSSKTDADFVKNKANEYGLPFYLGKAELGPNVSEEQARISRYEYFAKLTNELNGEIYTAHHLDDLVESIAINLVRGTGWRGLTPFGNKDIKRPFIKSELLPDDFKREILGYCEFDAVDKTAILKCAAKNGLVFCQDPTNTENKYLRNRLREKMRDLNPAKKTELLKIYHETNNLRDSIDSVLAEVLPKDGVYQRAWFDDLDENVAIEILRAALNSAGISATRPQMLDFLRAIREYGSGKQFNLPGDKLIRFSKSEFNISSGK